MRKLVNQEEYKDVNEELLHSLTQWQERCDHHLKADAEYLAEMAKREKQLEGIILPGISTERRHTETAKKSESDSVELLKERGNEISKLAIDIADLCNENLW
jgi:hypothetical protein